MLGEAHFLGFDPTKGYEQMPACPAYDPATVIVWFERWFFTGWSYGVVANTGIDYTHCYAAFDALGNVVSTDARQGYACCGFSGNLTCKGLVKCPEPDEWLDRARDACKTSGLPAPGTIMLNPRFRHDYGTQRPPYIPPAAL